MVLKCVELFSVLFFSYTPPKTGSYMSIYKCNKYPEKDYDYEFYEKEREVPPLGLHGR